MKVPPGVAQRAYNVGGAPPATVVIAAPAQMAQPVPNRQACCSAPADAPQEVKLTWTLSIAVIVTHSVALLADGFFFFEQWIGSLCGIIAGGVLLCCYQKSIYTCAPIFYILAAIFDTWMAIFWLYYGVWLAIFPVFAAVSAILAAVCGFKACSGWQEMGIIEHAGPVVSVHQPTAHQQVGSTVVHMPQMAVAPPPAYGQSHV